MPSFESWTLTSVLERVKVLKSQKSSVSQDEFASELQTIRISVVEALSGGSSPQAEWNQVLALLDSMLQSVQNRRVSTIATVARQAKEIAQLARLCDDKASIVAQQASEIAKLKLEGNARGARIVAVTETARTDAVMKIVGGASGGKVQLALVLDGTGSMSGVIEAVKSHLCKVCDDVTTLSSVYVETALVVYRDHCDPSVVDAFDFADPRTTKTSIGQVVATGGGDEAEAVLYGLNIATTLRWSSAPCTTKLILHCGDAPPHGRRLHDGVNDGYPEGHPQDPAYESVMRSIGSAGISYTFLKLNASTNKMYAAFEDSLLDFDIEVDTMEFNSGAPAAVMLEAVKKTTVRVGSGAHAGVRKMLRATPTISPCFLNLCRHQVTAYHALSVPLVFHPSLLVQELCLDECHEEVQLASTPFAKGAERVAHCCLQSGRQLVAKRTIAHVPSSQLHSHYETCLRLQVVAAVLAQEYSELRGHPGMIHYDPAFLIREGREYFVVEPYINGTYDKWSNNAGGLWHVEDGEVHAFSHWTYERTNKHLILVDLQGTKESGNRFHFTDPAVHTSRADVLLHATNLHTAGIAYFFITHRCNDVCKALGLEKMHG